MTVYKAYNCTCVAGSGMVCGFFNSPSKPSLVGDTAVKDYMVLSDFINNYLTKQRIKLIFIVTCILRSYIWIFPQKLVAALTQKLHWNQGGGLALKILLCHPKY